MGRRNVLERTTFVSHTGKEEKQREGRERERESDFGARKKACLILSKNQLKKVCYLRPEREEARRYESEGHTKPPSWTVFLRFLPCT